jgi:DNA-binding transcriptional regulator YiaG
MIMKEWTPGEIKTFREKRDLYQREFADLLGVTREYIVYLEKGVKKPGRTMRLFLDCLEKQFSKNEKGKEGEKRHGKRHL